MNATISTARLAGLYYILLIITGIFSLAYVPTALMVANDATATVANVRASEMLFRWSIVAGLACQVFYILLPLTLYQLLKPVDELKARLMAILAIASVPISFVAYAHKLDVLALLGNTNPFKDFDPSTLQAQIILSLESYDNTIFVASIFWGLWLFPFGYLVYKSGFLPKILGIFLMLGCLSYLIEFVAFTLWPNEYRASGLSSYIQMPRPIGEIGIGLWLLIMGAKKSAFKQKLDP